MHNNSVHKCLSRCEEKYFRLQCQIRLQLISCSVCYSFYILHISHSMRGSLHPDYCPAHTYSSPTDMMMSSCREYTITFSTILLNTFPTAIGRNSGFLSNGIRRQDRKALRVIARSFSTHSFFIYIYQQFFNARCKHINFNIFGQTSTQTIKTNF